MQWCDDQEEQARIFKKYTAVRIRFLDANPVLLPEMKLPMPAILNAKYYFHFRAHEFWYLQY